MTRTVPTLGMALLLGMTALAAIAQESSNPAFLAQPSSGASVSGALLELGDKWSARIDGPKGARVEAGDLIELRRSVSRLPPFPSDEQLLLANGDRLPGKVARLSGESVYFMQDFGERKEMRVPLTAVAVIWLQPPDHAA